MRFSIIELLVSDDVSGSRDRRETWSVKQNRITAIPFFRSDAHLLPIISPMVKIPYASRA